MSISRAQLESLREQQQETLSRWWRMLNSWKWPSGLPEPEKRQPPGHNVRRTEIMNWIQAKIGKKRCLNGETDDG